jgi:hypothetical protein
VVTEQPVYQPPPQVQSQELAVVPVSSPPSQPRISTPPATPPAVNLLSHTDGSLLVQEVFLVAGTRHPLTGQENILDLQGIWARVLGSSSTEAMKLSFRMANQSSNANLSQLQVTFEPNNFGLMLDPSANLLPSSGSLEAGQTHMTNVNLYCSPENQRINLNEEITALTVNVDYVTSASSGQKIRFQCKTQIPLHIFFLNHPQNPNAAHESVLPISCSDDGPRMTQSAYLDQYQSDEFSGTACRQFSVPGGIAWKRWYSQVSQIGLLDAIVGKEGARMGSNGMPTAREILKVIEYKLSMNRVYVVASRETQTGAPMPDLVFFISFRVGDGNSAASPTSGSLIMGEVRFLATTGADTYERCDVTLKSKVNTRMWPALERAIRAIVLS